MFLAARLALLSLLFLMVSGQRSKDTDSRPQGRTLGLLTPLLLGGGRPLFDVPLAVGPPIRPGGSSSAGGGGTQSDSVDSYYGGGYPSYGYRPNYGYGYPSYGYNYGYPGLGYGYGNFYRPSYYNYGGYQRPQYYGYRPNYSSIGAAASSGYPSNGGYGSTASISSSPSSNPATSGVGVGASGASGTGTPQLSTAQQAQLAGILGQALGSSLRPLLSNGGGAAGAPGAGANPQALSGLLSLLG